MAGASSGVKRPRPPQSARGSKQPIEKGRWAAKGTKPLPEQASVKYVLTLIVVHVCRKVLFIPTEVKIMLYSMGLFFGSLICDFLPLPQVYMGQRDNVFNLYYVKVRFGERGEDMESELLLSTIRHLTFLNKKFNNDFEEENDNF